MWVGRPQTAKGKAPKPQALRNKSRPSTSAASRAVHPQHHNVRVRGSVEPTLPTPARKCRAPRRAAALSRPSSRVSLRPSSCPQESRDDIQVRNSQHRPASSQSQSLSRAQAQSPWPSWGTARYFGPLSALHTGVEGAEDRQQEIGRTQSAQQTGRLDPGLLLELAGCTDPEDVETVDASDLALAGVDSASLSMFTGLTDLDVSGSDVCLMSLEYLPAIERLKLCCVPDGDPLLGGQPSGHSFQKLHSLSLAHNRLQRVDSLGMLISITSLNVSHNPQLTEEVLFSGLRMLPHLCDLVASSTAVTSWPQPTDDTDFASLVSLDLSSCKLLMPSDIAALSDPHNFPALQLLDISENSLPRKANRQTLQGLKQSFEERDVTVVLYARYGWPELLTMLQGSSC